ncbi:cupin domain-containing protein [Micromonospora parathelypteridis]|uniref:Quercetin dioxygenase-like cupin family protein n=1 Tax=Micromonospora parathelypteridis TaxID=1839617 RepID=A0A840VW90_9ACTN|nr:cupin domain-containing protein [Micromonospora parathelypteridis]MBB5480995.1 quercetin dioxygenase-like cupin family protein [Micromonospora parathelypteridis]GGO20590.1 cupin [Micromonospora parathelypteridis]
MTYTAEFGAVSALHYPEAAQERMVMRSGTVGRFVAPGTATQGRFGLFEWRMPARAGGADAHFHRTFSESFYVVSGTVRLYGGSGWIDGRPGDFLHVPEGGVHGFRNDSDAEAVMLILFAPGIPREAYFRELAEIAAAGRTLSEEEWTDLFARHDQYRA